MLFLEQFVWTVLYAEKDLMQEIQFSLDCNCFKSELYNWYEEGGEYLKKILRKNLLTN